jgi:hypothetical protein
MKIRFRKKLCFLLLFAAILLLTGCGIEVSTDLSLDQEFQGSRTITCYLSYADVLRYQKTSSTNIDTIIESNCPDCLEYKKKDTGTGYEFIFTLSFQSLEEYKTALGSILNFNPEIQFTGSESIFCKGLKLSENFTSEDLLRWFEVLLKDEYSISDDQISSLWETGETTVEFLGTTYRSEDSKINISAIEYSDFDGIDIYTTENDDRTFERLIRFRIPTSTLDKHSKELEDFFEARLPKNATAYWVPTKKGKNYELTIYADDFRTLSEETATALDCSDPQATSTSSFEDYDFFQYDQERMEKLDFSYFLCTETDEVPVTYYYKPNSISALDTEQIQKKINNSYTGKADKNGFYCLFDSTCTTLNVGVLETMTLPVDSYEVTTTLKDNGQFERTFLFYFTNYLTETERNQMTSFFEKNNTARLQMSVEFKNSGNSTLTIEQSGTKDSLNYSSRLLFGSENNSVDYKKSHSIFDLNQNITLKESIDLSRFLGSTNGKINGEYKFFLDARENLKKFSIQSDQSDIAYQETNKNDNYRASISGSVFTVSYTGTLFYPLGIVLLLLLLLLLAASFWLLTKRNPMKHPPKKLLKKSASEDEVQNENTGSEEEPETVENQETDDNN